MIERSFSLDEKKPLFQSTCKFWVFEEVQNLVDPVLKFTKWRYLQLFTSLKRNSCWSDLNWHSAKRLLRPPVSLMLKWIHIIARRRRLVFESRQHSSAFYQSTIRLGICECASTQQFSLSNQWTLPDMGLMRTFCLDYTFIKRILWAQTSSRLTAVNRSRCLGLDSRPTRVFAAPLAARDLVRSFLMLTD